MYKTIHVNYANPGKYNPENHDASGPDTYCQSVLCDENEYVSGNQCLACPPGTYNAPGDDASIINTNTACDAIMCDTGYRVQNHTCVGCESGKYNTENHDASGEDTECEWITCDENELCIY